MVKSVVHHRNKATLVTPIFFDFRGQPRFVFEHKGDDFILPIIGKLNFGIYLVGRCIIERRRPKLSKGQALHKVRAKVVESTCVGFTARFLVRIKIEVEVVGLQFLILKLLTILIYVFGAKLVIKSVGIEQLAFVETGEEGEFNFESCHNVVRLSGLLFRLQVQRYEINSRYASKIGFLFSINTTVKSFSHFFLGWDGDYTLSFHRNLSKAKVAIF